MYVYCILNCNVVCLQYLINMYVYCILNCNVVCLQYLINVFHFLFNSWRHSHCNRSDSHRVFLLGRIINIIFYSLISANIYFCVHVVIETTFWNVNLKIEDVIVNHIHLFLCSCCHRNNILKCELKNGRFNCEPYQNCYYYHYYRNKWVLSLQKRLLYMKWMSVKKKL